MTFLTNNRTDSSFRSKSPGPNISPMYTPRIQNKSVEPARYLERLHNIHDKIQQKQKLIVEDIRNRSLML